MDYIKVKADGIAVGTLYRSGDTYSFNYDSSSSALPWVSLTMPYRARSWNWTGGLHPVFGMNLPEGYLFELLKQLVMKELGSADDFSLLSLLSGNVRGRLEYESPLFKDGDRNSLSPSLEAIFSSGDGVMKTWGEEYPHLAENEYFCMTVARKAGLPVSSFFLSDDRKLFVTERFDRSPGGGYLGFEDFCVLQAKNKGEKYSGSYEQAAKTIADFVSPQRRQSSLRQYYMMLVISMLLRNGDAHLKNFGILYSPDRIDRYLAPCYDVVTTTAYVMKDRPALAFSGRKFWPGRKQLVDFGIAECQLGKSEAGALYDECARAVAETVDELEAYSAANLEFAPTGRKMLASWMSSRDGEPKKDIADEILGNRTSN